MPTILHISDLHRDPDSELTTDTLIESLRHDRDRYLAEGISSPDLVVVSGDLVLGVKDNDDAGARELQRQYDEAAGFLAKLADQMLSGDRTRIVLVPGNHDVSHSHVLRATETVQVPTDAFKRREVAKELRRPISLFRWDSAEFAIRKILDRPMYARRLEPFASFYSAFYGGARQFSLEDADQCELFDFPELGISIVGLSSCSENDLFNRAGRIHPNCVAAASQQVSSLLSAGRVAIAVWHHNLAGGPKDSDYLDPEFLQSLMDGGFTLGLHGHQHRPQYIEHRFTADKRRGLAVVSAGTLCGGPATLPSGRMPSYNLIEIDPASSTSRLHVRDMKNSNFATPVWGAAYVNEFGGSSFSFEIAVPKATVSILALISEATALLRAGEPQKAYESVLHYPTDQLARRVAVEALERLENWQEMVTFCTPPQSPTEAIQLMNALYEMGNRTELRAVLLSESIVNSTDSGVRQTKELMQTRLGGLL